MSERYLCFEGECKFGSDDYIVDTKTNETHSSMAEVVEMLNDSYSQLEDAMNAAKYFQKLYGGISESDVDMWPWILEDHINAKDGNQDVCEM